MNRKFALIFLLILLFSEKIGAEDLSLTAQSAILMDCDSGRVLYEIEADQPMLIASTTKIMTALLVIENCDLEEEITVDDQAIGVEGSTIYLKSDETLTVKELLYGLMLQSGNDAAVALAIHCSGSVEAFVDAMNQRARSLGLEHTSFANPSGLDDENHHTTAKELAIIACEAMKNDQFASIVKTKNIQVGSRWFNNHNKLLDYYDGAIGVKTGYTKNAGRTLVGCAERNGMRLISVTLNAPDDWNDHKKLFDYGFNNFEIKELMTQGTQVGEVPVLSGNMESVAVVAGNSLYYPLKTGERIHARIERRRFIYAPVVKNASAGQLMFFLDNGDEIGRIPLYYEKEITEIRPESKFPFFG